MAHMASEDCGNVSTYSFYLRFQRSRVDETLVRGGLLRVQTTVRSSLKRWMNRRTVIANVAFYWFMGTISRVESCCVFKTISTLRFG